MTVLSIGHASAWLVVQCMLALFVSGSSDLVTPVTKVTEMLTDMKAKSEKLQVQANVKYSEVSTSCTNTKLVKEDEIKTLTSNIETIDSEVLALETDMKDQTSQMGDDAANYHQASLQLDELRKNRAVEQENYQRDVSEYAAALSAVQRAIDIMQKHSSGLNFLQVSKRSGRKIQSALNDVAASVRQLSAYTPDAGGLAKDEKIFDDFNTLTTNAGAYSSQAGTEKGVIGVLTGLQTTFQSAKAQLMDSEKSSAETFTAAEQNLQQQIATAKEGISMKKETVAIEAEMLTKIKKEREKAQLTLESTTKFLTKLNTACENKKQAHEEMSQLRTQEIAALTKALEVISGKVAKTLFVQSNVSLLLQTQPKQKNIVLALKDFIVKEAGSLHSSSLMQLVRKVGALSAESPADAIAKVKTMISELIVKLQQDSAADATQKKWCDEELTKNDKEKKDATADIDKYSAMVAKLESDEKMMGEEIVTLNLSAQTGDEEKAFMEQERDEGIADYEEAKKDTEESIEAVEAAITVLTEYYKNASEAVALTQKAADPLTNNTMPSELADEEEVEGPLQGEGANVIAMLEVVEGQYKTLLVKLQSEHAQMLADYQSQITEAQVMVATAKADAENKATIRDDMVKQISQGKSDLNASQQALVDAEKNYENLKAPCLNEGAAEQRKQQLESEIAALNEALTMLDEYQGASSAALLQQWKQQAPAHVAFNAQGIRADPAAIERIAELLKGIKSDVEKDMAADTAAYNEMTSWCTSTITDTEAAIKVQRERDSELVTAVEVSTQQKAVLTTQLAGLNSDLAKSKESLDQMGQLRSNDQTAFQTSEKELIVAITSLRNAIDVLKTRYAEFDKQDQRNFKEEQAQIEAEKATSTETLNLVHVADNVAKALKALPANQMNLAITGETGAILQEFLTKPQQVLVSLSRKSGLTQTGSKVSSDSPSGESILGILESLMDTFTADLAAIRDKETSGKESYSSTKAAKQSQISAMEASISTKEGQLAHYTTMHSQAKEDLAYLRKTTKQDVAYLAQVREQCRTTENDYQLRHSTRTQEIAAISEAIGILTASSSTSTETQAPTKVVPVKTLVHTGSRVRRVFVSHRSPAKRQVLKIASPHPSSLTPPRAKEKKHAPKALIQFGISANPLKQSLASLVAQVKTAHRQLATGPLTSDAIKSVVTKIDDVVADLQTQKKLEIKKKDTCVTEKNDASLQRERRLTDQAKLESTIQQLTTTISGATDNIAELEKHLEELNNATEDAKKARSDSHAEYKSSVQQELEHQEVLHEAIAALKKFYAEKAVALIQASPPAHLQTQHDGPEEIEELNSTGAPIVVNFKSFGHSASGNQTAGAASLPVKALVRAVSMHAKAIRSNGTSVAESSLKNQTEEQKQLDDGIEKNMDTKWSSVKDVGANRTEGPKGFSKPLKTHEGSIGVVGILEILLEDSESLIEEDVKSEQNEVNMHLANLEQTKQLIQSKEDEVASLLQAKNDAVLKKTQAEESLTSINKEITEIDEFLLIVEKQCKAFLENFTTNQEARAAEINDVKYAKEVLLGMVEDANAGGAAAATLLEVARLTDRLQVYK